MKMPCLSPQIVYALPVPSPFLHETLTSDSVDTMLEGGYSRTSPLMRLHSSLKYWLITNSQSRRLTAIYEVKRGFFLETPQGQHPPPVFY